ncbi:MAG: efflux RND transporter periplasmic adaptor subunit [Candidatus Omnitrophota bacterium]
MSLSLIKLPLLVLFLFGWMAPSPLWAAESAPSPNGSTPPPEASYIVTEATTVPLVYEFVGITAPSKIVEIRARIRGFLDSRLFKEGAAVKEGELLFKIESESFEADVEVAAARVEQATARLRLAEREWERVKKLRVTGNSTPSDFDKAQMENDDARASLRLANADLAKAKLVLSYTKIHAPLNGSIGKSYKEPGSLVDDGQNSLLAEITQTDPIYVSFKMSEREYLTWRQDVLAKRISIPDGGQMRFRIVLQDGAIFGQEGKLNFEDPVFHPETGTSEYRAEFPNPDAALKPGQFVTCRMEGWTRPHTIAVPQRAVNQIPSGAFVLVVNEKNVAEFRKVALGAWSGKDWIIAEGLEPGEKVIVDGMKAQPGMVVHPVPYREYSKPAAAPQG